MGSYSVVDARAYAFGEECRMEFGDATFHAMETDFRVRVAVDFLSDEEVMGNSIRAVMTGISAIPQEKIVGPRPGTRGVRIRLAGR